MTGAESLAGVALGVGLGARHALEPDHLAAVSVLAADGASVRRGALIGALWGAGHTLSLLACGLFVAIAAGEIPARLTDTFEIVVAAMLILLGGRAVYRAVHGERRGAPTAHHHRLGGAHAHPGPRAQIHGARRAFALRPLLVGAVHGLAGSGALVALATVALPTVAARVAFIGMFGFGSIAAMTTISALAGWPLARLARRPVAARALLAVGGVLSVALGVLWTWIRFHKLLS